MPELPEVETVRTVLKENLIGLYIKDISIYYEKMILCDTTYFKECIINKKITNILRKGKVLIFELEDIYLISHLRMEGKYFIKDLNDMVEKHEHIIFKLSNDKTLRYHDTRKFGVMCIKTKDDLYNTPPLSNVSFEPFDINSDYLYKTLQTKKAPIKTVLLDQSVMSGLGNIYVDEVLFLCKIHPLTKSCDITISNVEDIINKSIEVLNKAIEFKGTTIRSYTSSLGVSGNYQQFLNVHTKDMQKCNVCGSIIQKIKVGGRGTYICPICQKL